MEEQQSQGGTAAPLPEFELAATIDSLDPDKPQPSHPITGYLTGDEILGADDVITEAVYVPEWANGRAAHVLVKSLSGVELDAFETSIVEQTGGGRTRMNGTNLRAKFCQLVMVDEQLQPLFTAKQVIALGRKSAAALDRVYATGQRLSKRTQEDMDELVGNSSAAPGVDSSAR
jgi:hypothetical protein